MSPVFDVSQHETRSQAMTAANEAIGRGRLVVMPTDTVYGVAANPFDPNGVAALLAAKGRGRDKPPAVLVPNRQTVDGLAMNVPSYARRLMERFWPGGLTLIFRAQPSLMWDLGETNGTVGLRMPDDEIALELLTATGPLAVSSANLTGEATARTVTEAGFMFGRDVDVYVDGGERGNEVASTIIDCTKPDPMLLRQGTITTEQLREVLGPIDLVDSTGAPLSETPREETHEPTSSDSSVGLTKPASGAVASAGSATSDSQSSVAGQENSAGTMPPSRPSDLLTQAGPGASGTPTTGVAAAGIGAESAAPAGVGATSLADTAPTGRAEPMSVQERERLDALGAQARAGEPTRAIPMAGVGAEPPFERESVRSAELPGRSGPSND